MIIGVVCALATIYWIVFVVRGLFWHESVVEAIAGIVFGVVFAAVLIRAATARAVIEGDRLTVVNTFRTTRINANEILEFHLGPRRSTVFYGAAAAELHSGEELIIFGIQSHNPLLRGDDDGARRLVEQLNGWLHGTKTHGTVAEAAAKMP